jgi:hypothetical protein
MSKVQFVSKCLKWIFGVVIFLLPTVQIVFWMYAEHDFIREHDSGFLPYGVGLSELIMLGMQTRFYCLLISMIPTGLVMGIFVFLFQLFSQYAKGNIFDAINISLIKKIAYLLLARTLIGPLYEAFITGVWTLNNPAGERMSRISSQTLNLTGVITVLVILVVAWVMAHGHKLQQEQELTV